MATRIFAAQSPRMGQMATPAVERISSDRYRASALEQVLELEPGTIVGLLSQEIRSVAAGLLAGALRERGISEPAASLTGQAGIAIFRVAFERWVNDPGERDLPELIRESFDELKALTAGT